MSSWKTAGAVGTFVLAFAVTSLNLAWSEDTKLPNLDVAAAHRAALRDLGNTPLHRRLHFYGYSLPPAHFGGFFN